MPAASGSRGGPSPRSSHRRCRVAATAGDLTCHALSTEAQTTARPRAVLLSAWTPGLTGNGPAIRVGVALEALAQRHDVYLVLVPVYGPATVDDWVRTLVRHTLVLPDSVADPFLRRVHTLASPTEQLRARLVYPRPMHAMFCTREAAAEIVDFVDGDIDLLYAFRVFTAPLAEPWLSRAVPPRVVIDVDEDDVGAMRQIASLRRLAGEETAAEVAEADADKLSSMAAEWLPRADLLLAAAPDEVTRLESRYAGTTVNVLPNPTPPQGEEGHAPAVDLLFVGNCSYVPNIDAARWLCLDVLPRLRRLAGRRIQVAVVGSAMHDSVAALAADPDVTVVADAPSVTPWYRAAKVAVVPLRAGGGTRLKILEAFNHRLPVVSTSLGSQGLPVTHGVELLVADSADDIAAACARLLADDELRAALVEAATAVALARARPAVVSRLVEALGASTNCTESA